MSEAGRVVARREVADEDLMGRYADGDVEAFDELFRRYERRAYAFFLKRTGSHDRAEDLYQELFLRIHRGRRAYDPARPFLPWFFKVAHHLLLDDVRRAFRSREVPLAGRDLRSDVVERALADREALDLLLAPLTPGERYVLVSSKLNGTEYSELAAGAGKSVDAVKKMASRAMQRIRASRGPGVSRLVDPDSG